MQEEKEIEEFKPSCWLYVFLFIYYSIWLLQGFGAISHYWTFGFESFQQYGLEEWLFFPVYLAAAFFSLYAVIKTLRGGADCITALKWSLIIVVLLTTFFITYYSISIFNLYIRITIFFACPLFYLIFYLYLCFTKGIKLRYPKKERRFGPSGWVWIGILTVSLAIGVVFGIKQYKISQYCHRVTLANLNLHEGEISDGYVLFKSDREWKEWEHPSDTLCVDERIETLPTMESVDSTSIVYLMSGRCLKPDARTHNQIIVASMGLLRQNEIKGNLREVSYIDTIVNGYKLMATSFELVRDSIPSHFTVMNLTDSISPKCSVFVRLDKGNLDEGWIIELANSVRFDLQNIAKGEDYEKGNDTKYKKTDRIGYSNDQASPNMLASHHKSILPRFLFGVVFPKNCEREIADCECYNVFKNL